MGLGTRLRRRRRDRAQAVFRRLSTSPEWEHHVRQEFALLPPAPLSPETVLDGFHRLYYEAGEAGRTWKDTTWFGVPIWKSPLDLWIYQELIHELAPDLIVETGSAYGGSGLYLAMLCEAKGKGEVVSIDIGEWPNRPRHQRLTYITDSSTDPVLVERLTERARGLGTVLVVLDSDHRYEHVLAELRAYSSLVTPGSYLVVEDTNINGHPVHEDFGPGPMEAVNDFLKEHDNFAVDPAREKLLLTFNPQGWLKRLR